MRLVICDDHRLLLEALAVALGKRGYTVEAVALTPEEAVSLVELHDPDTLLIDVSFPSGSGLDAARLVMQRHPRTKVVMITGSDALEPLAAALDLGVAAYTRKDQSVDGIARVLDAVAHGEVVIDPTLVRRVRHQPPTETSGPLDALTPRERRVLALLSDGLDTREIQQVLGVSRSTVRTHVQNILAKLGVNSRLQAVAALGGYGQVEESR